MSSTPERRQKLFVRVDQLSEEDLIMKRSGQRCAGVLTVTVLAALCGAGLLTILAAGPPADWPQWGRDPQHTGEVGWNGQNLNRIIEDIVNQAVHNWCVACGHNNAPAQPPRQIRVDCTETLPQGRKTPSAEPSARAQFRACEK